ncbi:NAD-dependent epimerase/dehydratase family protein [Dactylosporangium sp. CA-092794]|uniref:NAD-dependent epimerase/dehydratase family protein n=1 Tax=Dactylosporangium sp. CA-092794 TaxID=3239929 RepID=UPI003D90DB1D
MDTFVIGATGFVGGGVARHLAARGHRVTGLARTGAAAERLRRDGIAPHPGDLDRDRRPVLAAAAASDVVVYAAQLDPAAEADAVGALLDALAGSGRTFVLTSGTGVFLQRTGGAWSSACYGEDDPFPVEPLAARRRAVEELVRGAAGRGIRTLVLRPGLIWGPGDHGHVAMVYRSVAATGAACYVGAGLNTYTNVHIDDVARLYERAIAAGTAGALYHAAGGEVPNRWIAEAVARDLGRGTRSLSPAEASAVWGDFGALIMAGSSRSRDQWTRAELGWSPERPDMLALIGEPRLRELAAPQRTTRTHQEEP